MEILFLVVTFLMQGIANMETEVTGVSGENITITCTDDYFLDNVKYFCKRNCRYDNDVLIKSRGATWYSNGKYSIRDAKRQFYVTIFHLTKEDAGTYWCVWEILALDDEYKKVSLTVREATTSAPKPTTTSPKQVHPKPGTILFVVLMVCGVVATCVCLGTLILVVTLKCQRVRKQQKREMSADYENVMVALKSDGHCRGSRPKCEAHLDAPKDLTLENQESGFSDYENLDLSQVKAHAYDDLHGKKIPKQKHRH
ncbi:CMRF35-like molecule 8 [Festucalex cinctus]